MDGRLFAGVRFDHSTARGTEQHKPRRRVSGSVDRVHRRPRAESGRESQSVFGHPGQPGEAHIYGTVVRRRGE